MTTELLNKSLAQTTICFKIGKYFVCSTSYMGSSEFVVERKAVGRNGKVPHRWN